MKIAVLSVTQGEGHGAESVLVELMRAWVASETRDELFIVAPERTRVLRIARELDLPHAAFVAGRDGLVANYCGLRRVAGQFDDADIIHAWTARAFEFGCRFRPRSLTRVAGTLHDHPKADFHGRMRQRLIRYYANRMQGLACVSEAVHQACDADGYRCPMTVIHNGLEDGACTQPSSGQVRIGFLGMYATWKGFAVVQQWISGLVDEDVVWHLYGDIHPAHREGVDALLHASPARIVLRGHQDTATIFREIDILAHASTGFDPLPTVLIEAARAGLPAVASSLGGSPEIVRHGDTGFVFSPAHPDTGRDHLCALVQDVGLRQQMGSAARRHYEAGFRVDRMIEGYVAFWRGLG